MIEMEKLQSKPEVAEEELRAIEEDVTSKILLASWRGTRFEVVQVLREVVDAVLKDHSVEEQVLVNRAKVRPPSASLPSSNSSCVGQWDPRTHPPDFDFCVRVDCD